MKEQPRVDVHTRPSKPTGYPSLPILTNLPSFSQGPTSPLIPPFHTPLPLWLALLLKRQRRANIQPPAWLNPTSLTTILDFETAETTAAVFSPSPVLPPPTTSGSHPEDENVYLSHDTLELSTPFLKDTHTSRAQANALPYHWLELSHLLLTHASDDVAEADTVRRLLRDLREVRMSKLRKGFRVLEGGAGLQINGVGGMEVAEVRGFVGGVVDGLRYVDWMLPLLACLHTGLVALTLSSIERSAVRGRRPGVNVKPKNKRTVSGAVPTPTMMTTTTCNYNVHFPFPLSGLLSLSYAYNVIYRWVWLANVRPSACGVEHTRDRKYTSFSVDRLCREKPLQLCNPWSEG